VWNERLRRYPARRSAVAKRHLGEPKLRRIMPRKMDFLVSTDNRTGVLPALADRRRSVDCLTRMLPISPGRGTIAAFRPGDDRAAIALSSCNRSVVDLHSTLSRFATRVW
jgi:hypothetical protein